MIVKISQIVCILITITTVFGGVICYNNTLKAEEEYNTACDKADAERSEILSQIEEYEDEIRKYEHEIYVIKNLYFYEDDAEMRIDDYERLIEINEYYIDNCEHDLLYVGADVLDADEKRWELSDKAVTWFTFAGVFAFITVAIFVAHIIYKKTNKLSKNPDESNSIQEQTCSESTEI